MSIHKNTSDKFSWSYDSTFTYEALSRFALIGMMPPPFFIHVKKHHDHSNYFKGNRLIGADLQFTVLVHCPHGGKHGGVQPDKGHEEEEDLRILHLDVKAAKRESHWNCHGLLKPQS